MKPSFPFAFSACALAVTCAGASAADVLVVDAAGGGAFTTIQAAVDMALDGDIVLVRAGTYPGDVVIDARTLTLVGEGDPQVAGHLVIQNLDTSDVVQLSGFVVTPSGGALAYQGALDIRFARGRVRVQDCELRGASAEGPSPYWSYGFFFVRDGGPGVLAAMSEDVALVDCVAVGGAGDFGVVVVSGWGGDGIVAQSVARLSVVRTVSTGGAGGDGDDPGHGGAGVRLVAATTLHLAYSACIGGGAGCYANFIGTPNWTVDGGHGLVRGTGTTTYDFEGHFFGGEAALGGCQTPAGGSPGAAQVGSGALVPLANGFPNTLHAPALVREGQPWALEVVAPAGELAGVRYAASTGFGFRPALEQPLLLGAPSLPLVPPTSLIPASNRLTLPQSPFQLPQGTDGDVVWLQGAAGATSRTVTFTSARFVVRLDASL